MTTAIRNIVTFLMTTLLIVVACTGQAQNKAIDSLNTLISKEKSDTARINLHNELIDNMSEINLDSAIALGKKVVLESRNIGFKKGEVDALRILSSSLMMKGDFKAARTNLNDAKDIALMFRDSADIATLYGTYGMMYGMQSKYDSSRIYIKKAIAIQERKGDKIKLGRNYGNLAIGYQQQSNYPQALLYQQKALQIAEEQKNINSQAYTSLNMGITYDKMGDTLRAEKTLLNALDLARQAGIKNVGVYSYTNLASLYTNMKKWDDTYTYALKAAKLAKEMGDIPIEAASYSKAAVALANLKKYKRAKDLIIKGMADAESSGQPIIICQLNSAMGYTLMLQEKYEAAIPFYEKCLKTFENSDEYDETISQIYSELSQSYEKTGDYGSALSNFKKYAAINDSVRAKENIQKATELTMNYEFEKKEQAQRLEQKNKDAIAYSRQRALMIGLGLTLILAIVAYRAFRIKQKGNAKLELQKEEIQKALSQLKSTQSQLIQAEKMASLGELTAGIAHEIKNPLNFVNNFSEMSTELIDEMNSELEAGDIEEAKEIAGYIKQNMEKINQHGSRADGIVKSMLQHSRKGSGTMEPVELNKLVKEYVNLAFHGMRAGKNPINVDIMLDLDENVGHVPLIAEDFSRVIVNLCNNAFDAMREKLQNPKLRIRESEKTHFSISRTFGKKAADQSEQSDDISEDYMPKLTVRTFREGNQIIVEIADNGTGIPEEIIDKILQPFFTTKKGTDGTGLGLSISNDIVKVHGGRLEVSTTQNKDLSSGALAQEGSRFTIKLSRGG